MDALDICGETDTAPARQALPGLLAAYEQNRLAGEHHGPRLISLEVYSTYGHARSDASDEAVPNSQELLQAVALPEVVP